MKARNLQQKLREILWKKMKNGGLTGMTLARQASLRQAHISNFMNGKRGLSLEAMDRVLGVLHLSVLDLLDPGEVNQRASLPSSPDTSFQDVPLVSGYVAASTARITRGTLRGILKFTTSFLRRLRPACEHARAPWDRFVAMRVEAREAMSMFPRLLPGATILLDRHYNLVKPYRPGEASMFLVRKLNGNCTIRYVETAAGCFLLRPHNHIYPVEMLAVPARYSISHYIVGRIAYIGIGT